MANLIEEHKGGKATVVAAGLSVKQGLFALRGLAQEWRASKPGRKAKVDGTELTLRWSDGKPARMFYLDPLPAPKGDEPGQKKRGSK